MEAVSGNQAFERLSTVSRQGIPPRLFPARRRDRRRRRHPGDLPQDLEALPDFRGDSSISTWIYAIARNTCLTRRRTAADRRTYSLDEANAAEIPSHDPPASDTDLRAAIGRLPAKYSQVLVLFYLEDRSYQQVALAMGLPMGTVKTYLHRAKKELALLLAAQSERKENAIPWPAVNSRI